MGPLVLAHCIWSKSTVMAVAVNRVSIRSESPSESEPSSRGEGPLNLERGKGVDPRNWGDLSDTSDINLEEQQTILESCNLAKELAQVPDEIETNSQQSDDHESVERTNKRPDCHNCDNSQLALSENTHNANTVICEWMRASAVLSTEPQRASEQREHARYLSFFC